MKKSGKICMLDGDSEVRQLFADWCGLRNYELLATDNLFQFLRYSKEMQPDLFVLDLDMKDVSGWEVAGMLASDEGLKEIPIVMLMLSEQQDLSGRYGVAHYLSELATMEKAAEIIEAYCVGRKKHDVLLLDEYGEKSAAALLTLGRQNLTCFEVHDLGGDKAYLKKNFPRCVCLYLPYEQCQEIQPQLKHDKIFYVENPRNLENLATLLQ